jgi:ABC-2 type transport system permease protein
VQSGNLNQILLHKLLFRLVLVCTLGWILSIAGLLMHLAGTFLSAADVLLWFFVLTVYLVFWFSVCWLVVVLRKSSRINSLTLLGVWLLLTLILPALMNKLAALKYPMPLRTELVSHQRETMLETWEMPIKELLVHFYRNNPGYLPLRQVSDTAQYGNKRFVAYYDLLGRRMNENVEKYHAAAAKHNSWLSKTAWINPVAQMQSLINGTARTDLNDYLFYQQQAGDFQNRWVKLMNSYLLADKKLSRKEVMNLPVFQPEQDQTRTARIFINSISILLAIALVLWTARKKSILK